MLNSNQIPLLTIKEAASRLHISTSTLRRLIKNDEVNIVKVGGGIRISNEEIIDFLSRNKSKDEQEKLQVGSIQHKIVSITPPNTVPKNLKLHYIIPGINSIEAETLETIISENVSLEEIFNFLDEEKYNKLLHLLKNIVDKYKLDSRKSLILLFIEEAISNLAIRKEILIDLVTIDKALMILPIPPHLFFYFVEFLSLGQIINSEEKIPPHLDSYKGIITNINEVEPVRLHQKFSESEILIIDGFKTKNGYLIRRSVANLIVQCINTIKKVYIHNIPQLPRDQNFALLENKLFSNKVVDI